MVVLLPEIVHAIFAELALCRVPGLFTHRSERPITTLNLCGFATNNLRRWVQSTYSKTLFCTLQQPVMTR